MKLTRIASPSCLAFILLTGTTLEMSEAGVLLPGTKAEATVEPPPTVPLDKKSFKTVPFDPAPSVSQRRELEQAIASCVKTVEMQVPGGHFEASADRGMVNTIGIDRENFKFWRCMTESGHKITPVDR